MFNRTPLAAGGVYFYAVRSVGTHGREPSSPVWYGWSYKGFYAGDWHQ